MKPVADTLRAVQGILYIMKTLTGGIDTAYSVCNCVRAVVFPDIGCD